MNEKIVAFADTVRDGRLDMINRCHSLPQSACPVLVRHRCLHDRGEPDCLDQNDSKPNSTEFTQKFGADVPLRRHCS